MDKISFQSWFVKCMCVHMQVNSLKVNLVVKKQLQTVA